MRYISPDDGITAAVGTMAYLEKLNKNAQEKAAGKKKMKKQGKGKAGWKREKREKIG